MENMLVLEKGKLNLHCASCIRVGNKLYFSEAFFNGLFEMDLNDFSVKFICHFSGESESRMLCHGGRVVRYKDIIYFLPTCIKRIHYYNFITGEENNIYLPQIGDEEEYLVSGVIQKDNKTWLFSAKRTNGVLMLDMDKKKLTKAEVLSELYLKYEKVTNFIEIPGEGKLYTYCVCDSLLLEIDVEKEQIKEYKVQTENANICAINYNEGKFYFTDGVLGDLYEWEWNHKNLRKFATNYADIDLKRGRPFLNCCFVNGSVYMIPYRSNYVMKVADFGIMVRAFEYPGDFQIMKMVRLIYEPPVMLFFEVVNDEIWFYPYGGNRLIIYNTNTGKTVGKRMAIDVNRVFPCEGMIHETNCKSLEYFFYRIKSSEPNSATIVGLTGEKIYKEII